MYKSIHLTDEPIKRHS